MKKSPFLIFAVTMATLIGSMLWFIQSQKFAHVVKGVVARHLPADFGMEGDFSEFAIKLFPPGISIRSPKLVVKRRNFLNLPVGSGVSAERIDLTFQPIQMLSGNIRVHEAAIINGDLKVILDKEKAPSAPTRKKLDFQWDQLLQVHADAIALENTRIEIESARPKMGAQFVAKAVRVSQWKEKQGPGFDVALNLEAIRLDAQSIEGFPSTPVVVDRLLSNFKLNAAGAEIGDVSLKGDGFQASVSGTMKGNVADPKDLLLDVAIKSTADLSRVLPQLLPPRKSPAKAPRIAGIARIEGSLRANLLKLAETLKADSKIEVRQARYQDFSFEQIETDLAWASTGASTGELAIGKTAIWSPLRERRDGRPGSGGKIELGPIKWATGSTAPVTIPLRLTDAHIHWLAPMVLNDIFALDFRLTGSVQATLTPSSGAKEWSATAKTDLSVNSFRLDNQRLGQIRPLKTVLRIPRIKLDGDLAVDPHALKPVSMVLTLPKSEFKLGGIVDFKSGLDLTASGPVNLDDIGEIAETPIHGEGTLHTHVHGPSSRTIVDFDADLKDANYLRLKLGALKGRITWDDAPQNLLFKDVQLARGKTGYVGNGSLALADKGSINLGFKIDRGDIHDFLQIFEDLTASLWWYPKALNGEFDGTVQVTGGLDLKELVVQSTLEGSDWEFLGERFRTVKLNGGYDKGTYLVNDFNAAKRTGKILGKIAFNPEGKVDWNLRTQDLTVVDFDHVAQLDVPMRGKISIVSSGAGDRTIQSETHAVLTDLSVRGRPMPPSSLNVRSDSGSLRFIGNALGGQGTLDLEYDSRPSAMSALKGRLQHLDFTPVLLLLNPKLAQDRSLTGYVSGAIDIAFHAGQAEKATGRIDISEYLLSKAETKFELEKPASIRMVDGTFRISDLTIRGNQGHAVLNVDSRKAVVDGRITGDIDVSLIEFLTSSVSKATGTATLDFSLGGTLKEPTIFGRTAVNGISVRVPALESPFESVTGAFQLRQNVITAQNIEADLAGGRVGLGGSVQLFTDRYPIIDLRSTLNGCKIKVFPFQFVKVHGAVNVHGDQLPYLVDGAVTIDSALMKEKIFNQHTTEGLKAAQYMPPTGRNESGYPKFKLQIEAKADRGIIVQNELFDAEVKGKVTVVNTMEAPRIVGTGELVHGRMVFKNREFVMQAGSAVFDNPTVINPVFDMTATTDINNSKIQLYAAGRMDNWRIELTSNPSMPESEIIQLLALGFSSSEVKRLRAGDRAVVEQGEAASLLLHSLDFNREVQNKTGFQIQLGESIDSQTGTSLTSPKAQAESSVAPKIVIKKQIGEKLDLSYGSTFGIGANSRKEVSAEYRFLPGFSLQGAWDLYDTPDVQAKDSYGVDLKWQRRFK